MSIQQIWKKGVNGLMVIVIGALLGVQVPKTACAGIQADVDAKNNAQAEYVRKRLKEKGNVQKPNGEDSAAAKQRAFAGPNQEINRTLKKDTSTIADQIYKTGQSVTKPQKMAGKQPSPLPNAERQPDPTPVRSSPVKASTGGASQLVVNPDVDPSSVPTGDLDFR